MKMRVKAIVIADSQLLTDCAVAQTCEKTGDLHDSGRISLASSLFHPSSSLEFFHALKDVAQASNGDYGVDVRADKSIVSVMYANTDKDSVYEESAKRIAEPTVIRSKLRSVGLDSSLKRDSSINRSDRSDASNNRDLRDTAVSQSNHPSPSTAFPANNGSMRSVIGEMAVDAAKWMNSVMSRRILVVSITVWVLLTVCCILPCVIFCLAASCVRKRWRRHSERLVMDTANDIDLADDPDEDLLPPPFPPRSSTSQVRKWQSAGSQDKMRPSGRHSLSATSVSKHIS